ncbi:MAG TPA: OsmC family protein [Gemmatimonadaceae bacterium]|nr:OsmC family protein [Gemmatimonadaceae bacterium]
MTRDQEAPRPTEEIATAQARAEGGRWVTTSIDRSRYRTTVEARAHVFALDEPTDVGGTDAGPTPYEALLAALGGCTVITLRMYADRKGWPLEGAHVRLRTASAHEPDCEICESEDVGPHRLERQIELDGPLNDEQRARLLLIADRCPVKQTLERGVQVVAS